jgi:hypothetical protein
LLSIKAYREIAGGEASIINLLAMTGNTPFELTRINKPLFQPADLLE